jgi:molybdate transport system ATP-binding protein
VLQEATLFPHMSVSDNVMIGVEHSEDARRRFSQLRDLLHIGELDDRRPHEISGGQQQRVALARALVRPTEVLLLDEPFSALDEALREDLRGELKRLQRDIDLPIVFVTHDLREAHLLADSIAVIDSGTILQLAPRDDVFQRPATRRVAELTGVRNLFEGVADDGCATVEGLRLRAPSSPHAGGPVHVAIRSERVNLRRFDPDGELPENCMVATIVEDLEFGNTHTLEVLGVASTPRWVIEFPPDDLHVMPSP